jgi:hypothetical protein
VGIVLIVGWPDASPTWKNCSAQFDLVAIEAGDVETALDLLQRISPVALVMASRLGPSSMRRLCAGVRARDSLRHTLILVSGPARQAGNEAADIDGYVADEPAAVSDRIRQWIAIAVEVGRSLAARRHASADSGLRRRRTDLP